MADLIKSSQAGDEVGPAARVGSTIKGKWKVESLLGVGGMAAVYAAAHRNGQRAALKILHADFAREKTICERFLREAYVSNKVNHSATCQVLDDDMTEEGEPFLIMELLEGETVRDAWKKAGRTMPVVQTLQIAERVLDCLASCHAISVIHRDLKPANIFITNAGEIKVLDFGVAQMRDATSERTATGTALGTPAYMSPEQAMGLVDQLDGRADIFSVGAMIHALITGHRINNGRTEQEALVMAATKPVPSVARIAPHLPIEVITIIDKSLAWDRRNRYADAREMQTAALEALANQGAQPLASGKARAGQLVGPAPIAPVVVAPAPPPVAVAPPPPPAPVMAPQPVPHQAPPPAFGSAQPRPSIAPSQTQKKTPYVPAQGSSLAPFAQQQVTNAAVAKQPVAAVVGEVPENDPRVQGLRDVFKHFDRVLPSVRQFGWQHPATERTLRTGFEAFTEALGQNPQLVSFVIRPYSFMTLGHAIWEPGPPFDSIPYNLFACGMRSLRMDQGISLEEMRELFALFLLDPGRDLPPEDDMAAAFWDRGLPHVHYECVDAFAEGDAAEREAFYGEADQLEEMAEMASRNVASGIEAKAMAVSTDKNALRTGRKAASPMALEEVVRSVYAQQLEMSRDLWSERYVDALVEGLLDAAASRDAPLVLASLRKSATDLVVAGRLEIVVRLYQAIVDRVRQRVPSPENQMKLTLALTNAMFGGETLSIALKRLREDPSGVEAFGPIAATLGANELPTVLAQIREPLPPALRNLVLGYIERVMPGRENEVAAGAVGTDPDTSVAIVNLLGRANTQAARQALGTLAQSEDVNVRVEVRVLMAPSPEHAQNDLGGMLENASALVRMAALRAICRYSVRGAWPSIARVIGLKTFNELGSDERRELMRAAIMLSPERGEPMALEVARKGGMLVSEEREATRAMAAEALGDFSRSMHVANALLEVSSTRWGTSEETRIAASNAAKKITARIEAGGNAHS